VYRLVATLREHKRFQKRRGLDFSAKEAVWLFVRAPSDLEETEKQDLALMCQASPTANMIYELVQEFMNMLRHRKGERLDDWLRSARDSHIREREPLRSQH
jgi:transposase